jgi:multidrug resistance efflux pump
MWLLLLLVAIPAGLWAAGVRPDKIFGSGTPALKAVTIDQGDIATFVVESGTLESANNATVRCQVEALLGTVGGMNAMGGPGGGQGGGRGGQGGGRGGQGGGGGGQSGGGGGQGGGGQGGGIGQGGGMGGAGTGKTATKGGSGGGGTGTGGGAGRTGAGAGTQATAGTGLQKPMITSFTYMVTPHIPIRPMLAQTQTATLNRNAPQMGDTRGGGGGDLFQERAGSTRILKILEEGTRVKAGDIVCWLDDAAFRDELQAQLIKWTQAKSWVEQAEKVREVTLITIKEYKEGILPQDTQLIEQYIQTCKIQRDQTKADLDWSTSMLKRGLHNATQTRAREYAYERTEIVLREALSMQDRLKNYTAPKIITNLEAKLAAIESDLQAQRAAYELEDQRKRDLEKAISNCVLVAPRDGIVMYYNEANGWGRVENQIQEGVTVRENQPIFQIPDPSSMRVKTRINESKVSLLESGTPAIVRVDALGREPLRGKITEVTVIPAPANGPFSDVKVYFANVDVEGHSGLRPGMTAEVEFMVDSRRNVPRIPVNTIRWFDGKPYAAIPSAEGGHTWKLLDLGLSDEAFAEIITGLEPGQKVIADPSGLPPPTDAERQAATIAMQSPGPLAR